MPVMENPTNNEANHNHTANEAGARGRLPGQLLTVADVIENDYDNIRDFAIIRRALSLLSFFFISFLN
jgi:hypothetical protein